MRKICAVALRKTKILVRIIAENGEVSEEREGLYNSVSSAVSFLRNVLYDAQAQDIVLAIDDEALYYRLKSEQERGQLRSFWDIPPADKLAVLSDRADGKYVYYALRYAKKETMDFYINILKKFTDYNCAIVPLDFLFYKTGKPAFVVDEQNNHTQVRLFDGNGAYFYKSVFTPDSDGALEKLIDNISIYVVRENIMKNIPAARQTEYPAAESLLAALHLQPENLLYFRPAGHKTKLVLWQKILLTLLSVWLGGMLLVGLVQGYRMIGLWRSINRQTAEYQKIENRVRELRYVEKDMRGLILRGNSVDNEACRLVLRQAANNKIFLKEMFYEEEKKLLYIVGLDRQNNYTALLRSLRNDNIFSALNPIYMQPLDDTTMEFKLMLTVR